MNRRPSTAGRNGPGLAVVIVAILVAGCAETKPPSAFEEAFDDDAKAWTEIESQLPPAPNAADLVGFQVSGATQFRFSVDAKSLSIGSDGVFRYTLVAVSPQGARNISYEGIRCETTENKIYAIGRSDGTWSRSRNASWARIADVSANRQEAALMTEYFCPDGYAARSPQEIIARMNVRSPGSEVQSDKSQTQQHR